MHASRPPTRTQRGSTTGWGGAGAVRIFTDIVSGTSSDRPELARLIDHARPGDSLCVTRIDRLGRSLAELLGTVEDLRSRGIHLASLEERIDTSSAAGELVFHVFGAIAHFERRLISERTRKGLAAARRRGLPCTHNFSLNIASWFCHSRRHARAAPDSSDP